MPVPMDAFGRPEVQVGDKTYLRLVARLVMVPAVPDDQVDPGTSVAH